MVDKTKLIKNAQKFLSKGQIDKAISSWEEVLAAYPDGNTYNLIGDLYVKKGDNNNGIDRFHKAAKYYMDEGFSLKANAIYKKVLNINPHDSQALISLGELNEEKNISTDAIKYYLAAADILAKNKKRDELLSVYNKILNLAPSNIQLKSKVAELFSKEGFVQEAALQFIELGKLYDEKDEHDDAKDFYMKSMELLPNNKIALMALSELAERTGDMAQALNYAQIAIERIGEDPELLLRLTHLHMESGSLDAASANIFKVVEADPENYEAQKLQASLHLKTGEYEKAWEGYHPLIDKMLAQDEFDKAAEILINFKDKNPIESRKALINVYKQAGDADKALSEITSLAEIYKKEDKTDEYIECLQDALSVNPDNEEILNELTELMGSEPDTISLTPQPAEPAAAPGGWPEPKAPSVAETPPPAEPAAAPGGWPEPDAPAAEETSAEVILDEANNLIDEENYSAAIDLLTGLKIREPDNMELHIKLKDLFIETRRADEAVTECIVISDLYGRQNDDEMKRNFLRQAYDINPEDPRIQERINELIGKEEAPVDEATLEALSAKVSAREPEPAETDLTEGLDIPELQPLTDTKGKEPELDTEVLEIFDEFKKGLAQEVDAEDTATHYDLGIGYKEMGLINDAISAFEQTILNPDYFLQSSSMLGICFMEKGEYDKAIEKLTGALMKTDAGDDVSWNLKYELGQAYEAARKPKEALQYYDEVLGWDPKFREVASKADAMRKLTESAGQQKEKKNRVSYI